jgi:hypothetical protein
MEGTAPGPACLFAGAPDVGKFTLIRSLQLTPEPKSPSTPSYNLRLDTKYYTADVSVRSVTIQQQDQQQQLPADAWEQLQALVLVFDASNQASFAGVQSWATARNTDSIEVKLLVANKADTLQQATAASSTAGSCRPQWLQDAMSWCVDEGFEYVEAAAGKPTVDAALQLDGEQQGVARVLAALQAHMWPGMVQKDWQPRALPDLSCGAAAAAAAAAATSAGAGAGSSSSRNSACKDQGSPSAAAADAADAAAGSNAGVAAPAAAAAADGCMASKGQQKQQCGNTQQLPDSGAAGRKAVPLQQQQQRSAPPSSAAAAQIGADDDEAGFDLDDFEQMMKQLQGEHCTCIKDHTAVVRTCVGIMLHGQRCLHAAAATCFCAGWWAGLTVLCMLVPTPSFTWLCRPLALSSCTGQLQLCSCFQLNVRALRFWEWSSKLEQRHGC